MTKGLCVGRTTEHHSYYTIRVMEGITDLKWKVMATVLNPVIFT